MSIIFNEQNKTFHLNTKNTSYIMQVCKDNYLAHIYWGRSIREINSQEALVLVNRASFSPNVDLNDKSYSLDTMPQEYPSYGRGDYRTPAFEVQLENGTTICDLKYSSYRILKGKKKLDGLPATYVENEDEATTLEVELLDSLTNLKVILSYTIFENIDVITRNVKFINDGTQNLRLNRALSMNVDFDNSNFDLLNLWGAWARERHVERTPLSHGNMCIESRRSSSSHQNNPFVALLSKDATEDNGDVYGFNFVYSGNFLAQVEVDQFSTTRVSMGINPFDFSWLLEPKESFQTPEVVMIYSQNGLGEMSRIYHKLYRTRLCRGEFRDKTRPVLINNWEATYFDFNAEKIENIAKTAKELGIELFVLDDGWFGKRNDDRSSLGDWFVNKEKLPNGIDDLAKRVNNLGLQFGLWFEPEMISPDSELYKKHPNWCIHVPNRTRSEGRNQLILDLSRDDVCEYIINTLCDMLRNNHISYVKWDMNRNMTEIGSEKLPPERQRETAHRYMLGLYKVIDKITTSFPNVLFESCSGGGGRFDAGMLYYMPQTWTSDDSDAIERLYIQYGTSIVYPVSTMGAHVSAVPNHQVQRNTPLKTRGNVAMSGNFGYELDLTKFNENEMLEVKEQVSLYKELRELVQKGDMYRLLSPYEGNETAWMFVSEDKSEAFVAYFKILAKPNAPLSKLKLKGLDSNFNYKVIDDDSVYGGDELMYFGINIPKLEGDFASCIWRLRRV